MATIRGQIVSARLVDAHPGSTELEIREAGTAAQTGNPTQRIVVPNAAMQAEQLGLGAVVEVTVARVG